MLAAWQSQAPITTTSSGGYSSSIPHHTTPSPVMSAHREVYHHSDRVRSARSPPSEPSTGPFALGQGAHATPLINFFTNLTLHQVRGLLPSPDGCSS
jgi:hypothetical protein